MRIEQRVWRIGTGWRVAASDGMLAPALVLFFAAPGTLDDGKRFAELRALYPGAAILGCTTGGEIADVDVLDGTIVATAIEFAHTRLAFAEATIDDVGLGLPLSQRLAELHGGRLEIASTVGSGTTVSVTLPPERVSRSALRSA